MKAMLFDLDNTLYDAQQYFLGAFESISKYVSVKYHVSDTKVYSKLVELWREKTSMYPHLFNDLLKFFQLGQDSLQTIVEKFNKYAGAIEPYPDVMPTLRTLKERGYQLGIVTDGNVERQKRKIELLKLEHLLDTIVYAREIGPKLSPAPFLAALERLGLNGSDAFYIGDNPRQDFKGAKNTGMKTVRILRGEFARIPRNEYIDFEIEKLEALLEITEVKV